MWTVYHVVSLFTLWQLPAVTVSCISVRYCHLVNHVNEGDTDLRFCSPLSQFYTVRPQIWGQCIM